MKRIYIISILAAICSLTAMAQNSPGLAHQTNGKDRIEFGGGAVALDYNKDYNRIDVYITDGENYDMTITPSMSQVPVFETTIDVNHYILDVSFLQSGSYMIDLTGQDGTTYSCKFRINQGFFILMDRAVNFERISVISDRISDNLR